MHLVSPPAANEITGGYLYDRHMARLVPGLEYHRVAAADLAERLHMPATVYILDSLYFPLLLRQPAILRQALAPVVLLCHGLPSLAGGLRSRPVDKLVKAEARMLQLVAGAIVPSRFMGQQIAARASTAKVAVCMPGVAAEFAANRRSDRAQVPRRILTVANWSPAKGHHFLLEALAELESLEWRWTIVGDVGSGPRYHRQVLQRARRLGFLDRLEVRPVSTGLHLMECFQGADVFALATDFESFGMSLAEAICAGLPVVSNRVGGVPEVVEHGISGLLCSPGDRPCWTQSLRRVLSPSTGEACLTLDTESARRRFPDWPTAARRFAAAVTAMIPGGSQPAGT